MKEKERACLTKRPNILLGVTGSVASIKLPLLCQQLAAVGELKVVYTSSVKHFIKSLPVPVPGVEFLSDDDEWDKWKSVGDDVLHIELRRWADIFIIAPASANTLAKLANGMADNLLTCVARAWDHCSAPLLVAPAMNTLMWTSPFTSAHLNTLYEVGVAILPPISKRLACGDSGVGAMAEPASVVEVAHTLLLLKEKGRRQWNPCWWGRRRRRLPKGAFQRATKPPQGPVQWTASQTSEEKATEDAIGTAVAVGSGVVLFQLGMLIAMLKK